MQSEIIALTGVLTSSLIGAVVAFYVSAYKTKIEQLNFEKQMSLQFEKNRYELSRERSDRKIDIAYKFSELNQKNPKAAFTFLNQVAKETAIGFLYLDDEERKSKIWIRNDSNILIGRSLQCDISLSDMTVSREHCVIHAQDNQIFVVPLNPTNAMVVDNKPTQMRTVLKNKSTLSIGHDNFIFFEL